MNNAEAQQILVNRGLLDPPADGKWGNLSKSALMKFQKLIGVPEPDGILDEAAKTSLRLAPPLPPIEAEGLMEKIISYYQKHNYWIARGRDVFNIVYIEGMYPDGTLNSDRLDEWNDTRALFQVDDSGKAQIVEAWAATCEPGAYYTYHRMNPAGAARIQFGQYWAWAVGMHGNSRPHEALVQVADVKVCRDDNEDGLRIGDAVAEGRYGVNQHDGSDMDKVGRASAGCLVGKLIEGQRKFMSRIKSDRRYLASNAYIFSTVVVPGDKL
ncbi:peptidoglycan-binding domain-containing protein [Scytonema sp. PCC 10023]|uniref:peptidoglycan-binding domain-containing protein n=1 Tax=Scytonema sp. PCC 10023 TaxID=1680591 RepID=UPI0039C718FF